VKAIAIAMAWALATEPVETEPVETQPVTTQPVVTTDLSPRRERVAGDRMVQAGVGVVVAGLVGYGLMAAGLAIGNRAEGDLLALTELEDIAARRDVLARGQLGNRLAIAGAVTATVALAVGIPLIVIGRRRHEAASPRAMVLVSGSAGSFGLRLQGRF
jgi:hypothetical protein